MIVPGLTVLLLLTAAPAGRSPSETLARGGSLKLPPPISAQIRPYQECLAGEFNRLPGLRTADAEARGRLTASAISACADVRRNAVGAADASLRQNKRYTKPAEREAQIERAFVAIDEGFVNTYLMFPHSAPPQARALTVDQAAIVYDQCLARAATSASRTDTPESDIFGLAKTACAETRTMLASDAASGTAVLAALDAIDAERAVSFPERTRKVREMRRAYQPQERSQN